MSSEAVIAGTRIPLTTDVAAYLEAVTAGHTTGLLLTTRTYADVQVTLHLHPDKSVAQRAFSAQLLCAGCHWAFPGSYIMTLSMRGGSSGQVIGATPGFAEFGVTGVCPQCGSERSILVFEDSSPESISGADVEAIRRYWRTNAVQWWQQRSQGPAICDDCMKDLTRPEGSFVGSKILCEDCTEDLLSDAVAKLRANPDCYGKGLLRTVRPYHR